MSSPSPISYEHGLLRHRFFSTQIIPTIRCASSRAAASLSVLSIGGDCSQSIVPQKRQSSSPRTKTTSQHEGPRLKIRTRRGAALVGQRLQFALGHGHIPGLDIVR